MIRRILDWLGLAKYPEQPLIDKRLIMGINGHIVDSIEEFKRMRDLGFQVARLDPVGDVPAMLANARAADMKTMISGTYGLDLHTVFVLWQPDYVCVANEPDQKKYWPGTMADLLVWLIRSRVLRTENTKLIFPCASGLGRGFRRYGSKQLVEFFDGFVNDKDLIGIHLYEKTPDMMLRKLNKWIAFFRKHGWTQKVFITEFGFRDDQGEDRQATYLVNALSMFSKHPEVAGACVYVWKDDPPENFGIMKATGLAKKAALRLLSSTAAR